MYKNFIEYSGDMQLVEALGEDSALEELCLAVEQCKDKQVTWLYGQGTDTKKRVGVENKVGERGTCCS